MWTKNSAPASVIVSTDKQFFEHMPTVFPNNPNAKALFEGNPALASVTATRNGTLSGAYFMLAARALGLDCGPMSGFDIAKVDAECCSETEGVQSQIIFNRNRTQPVCVWEQRARLSHRRNSLVITQA
jgi:3-hydroxypropanoate dehydrogenase